MTRYIHAAILAIALSLTQSCSTLDQDYPIVPGIVDRSLQLNILLGGIDTGRLTAEGLTVSDVNVVTWGRDLNVIARAQLAVYNGGSVTAAITQAALSSTVAGIALGGGPVGAAGGIGLASLFAQHIFGIVNTPAKGTATQQFMERNMEAESEYWASLAGEVCGANVSGAQLTDSGATYAGRLNASQILRDKAFQMTMPTLAQMESALVPAGSVGKLRARAAAAKCPTIPKATQR
jgi:hypothetical protein